MTEPRPHLDRPWLVAVWPGMGNVALAAGGYLLDQLDVFELPLPDLREHFDVDQAQIKRGVVRGGRFPRNRLYGWRDPEGVRDLLIFVGEAQPNVRGYGFCHTLLDVVERYDTAQVVTFASMVTPSLPQPLPRLYSVATSEELLAEIQACEIESEILEDGSIGGLNGTLLAAAAELDLDGFGILAEVPAMAATVPYLRASQRVLELFCKFADIELDMTRLVEQADRLEESLREMLQRIKQLGMSEANAGESDPPEADPKLRGLPGPQPERSDSKSPSGPQLTPEVVALIESLFLTAEQDHAKVWELKDELDRQGLFKSYEDRFLDLFS